MVFSDESRFTLSFADGRIRAWRRRGERHAQCCVRGQPFRRRKPDGLGSIHSNGRSRLVVIQGNMTAQVYCDQVLMPVLVPFIHNHGPGLTFQHDNATPHTAALTRNSLQNAGIPVMAWPSLSADMNPIEHVWDKLGRRFRNRFNAPQTLQAFEHALVDEWRRLPVFDTIAEIHEKTV